MRAILLLVPPLALPGTARRDPPADDGATVIDASQLSRPRANDDALLTVVKLVHCLGRRDLDINEVDLELLLGLDADQERRTTSSCDDLIGIVNGLEDEREGTFLLKRESDITAQST